VKGTSRLGKPSQQFLHDVVFRSLGAARSRVIVGPSFGVDNSIVRLDHNKVLVATTDPLSYVPSLGPDASAWLSVHLLASDITTSGFAPGYGLFDFNLPPTLGDAQFAKYWRAFDREWKKLGLSIIGGHTGRYPGLDYTIIGGGFVMAVGPSDRYLTSTMAKNGDDMVLTKGAAIETTAVLARSFPKKVRKRLGERLFDKAQSYLKKVTTVEDAMNAVMVGVRNRGVTAMHDATEGGVIAGIIELATASKLGAVVNVEDIKISEETREICKLFRIDPLVSLSEGSLIISSHPSKTGQIISKLSSKGIPSNVIGKLSSKFRGCRAVSRKGSRPISYPTEDPYWRAYSSAIKKKWA